MRPALSAIRNRGLLSGPSRELPLSTANDFDHISKREEGLQRKLTAGQMSMIAIGGAIGTGLFLGSKFAIGLAGPSVILSYTISGFITLLLMGCLAEMTIAHPTSGSFGAYAEHYISPLAGYLVRWAYWTCIVMGVGTEVTAIADYMQFWFTGVPPWIWIVLFSGALIGVNAWSVKTFGTVEYWFSTIKVLAIVGFILLGAWVVWGTGNPDFGVRHLTAHGGFFPKGLWGMWVAVVISIFSYLSIEMIAVAAGEAERPVEAVRKAFRATLARLVLFYLLSLLIILCIVPWDRIGEGSSPFVTVMQAIGIPYAAGDPQLRRDRGGAVGDEQHALHHDAHDVQPVAGRRRAGAPGRVERPRCPDQRPGAVHDRHRPRRRGLRALPGEGLHPDGVAVDVRRDVHVDDDLRDALLLPAPSRPERRAGPAVQDEVLSGDHPSRRRPDARGARDDGLHRDLPHDPGVRRPVPRSSGDELPLPPPPGAVAPA